MSDNKQQQAAKKPNHTVWDQHGTEYILTGKLGEGGQGTVCTTDRPGVLVKVFNESDSARRRAWINHLNWVLNQELDGLQIARPQALINKPVPGYVMALMDGLESLQHMLEKSHESLLAGDGLAGYVQTGGLRRRLALLCELARTLAALHASGLAYGDLSPANVFVSRSVGHHQLWLIDCDHLCASERLGHGHVHTPDYGAPEVVRAERGVNSLTDAWSFAVMAFELLTHRHPLKGDTVLNGDEEQETQALRGAFPWIHHPDGQTNVAQGGLPLELIATPRMQGLFEECFNAGRDDPLARPSVATWADALEAAYGLMLVCTAPDCRSHFYWNHAGECPFCDAPSVNSVLLTHAWHQDVLPEEPTFLATGDQLVLNQDQPLTLHLAPVGTQHWRETPVACELLLDAQRLWIEPQGGAELSLIRLDDNKPLPITKKRALNVESRRSHDMVLVLTHPQAPNLKPAWRFTW